MPVTEIDYDKPTEALSIAGRICRIVEPSSLTEDECISAVATALISLIGRFLSEDQIERYLDTELFPDIRAGAIATARSFALDNTTH